MRRIEPIYKAILQKYVLVRKVLAYEMLELYIPKDVYGESFQSTYQTILEKTINRSLIIFFNEESCEPPPALI